MPQAIPADPHSTIGDFIAHRTRLSFYCGVCETTREIDLHVLGKRLGFDHDLYYPEQRKYAKPLPVRCATCGTKASGMIVSPWTLPAEAKR
jgi:hypothetical protein